MQWKILGSVFLRHIYTGGSSLSPKMADTVRKLIAIENQMNFQMKEIFVKVLA